MALIRQSVNNEELVRRTRADIIAHLGDYWVLEIDRTLVGCVALHLFPAESKAELACLYVNKGQEGQGFGRKLMAFAEQLATEKGMKHIFALSTQTYNYFQQKGGYAEVSPETLPPERLKKWETSGRKSKVVMKATVPTAAIEVLRD
jgi:amino-acid N-acetyltransferase